METKKNLNAPYDKNSTHDKRMILSLILMIALLLFFLLTNGLSNSLMPKEEKTDVITQEAHMNNLEHEDTINKPATPPTPPRKPRPARIEMAAFTLPGIIKDEEVTKAEKPPVVEKPVVDVPPASYEGKGVVRAPQKVEEDWDRIFTKVEIDSDYPGGTAAWLSYLEENLLYPRQAIDKKIQGTVIVQFHCNKYGSISDVKAISGPNELCEAAVRVISKSGRWIPAIQNGRQVESRKMQPITFRLEME